MFTLPNTNLPTDHLIRMALDWEYNLNDADDHDDGIEVLLSVLEQRVSEAEHERLCRQCLANWRAAMDQEMLALDESEDDPDYS